MTFVIEKSKLSYIYSAVSLRLWGKSFASQEVEQEQDQGQEQERERERKEAMKLGIK